MRVTQNLNQVCRVILIFKGNPLVNKTLKGAQTTTSILNYVFWPNYSINIKNIPINRIYLNLTKNINLYLLKAKLRTITQETLIPHHKGSF